ncbi:MAG: dihydroorotase [Rhizobiaceae bacterium]
MNKITITQPDDWHLHLRDGEMLKGVIAHTSAHFKRAIIMPNLVPPVVTVADAISYRERILACTPQGDDFNPLMTLYLTETTNPDDVAAGFKDGIISAVKLYPAGATTNSQSGVKDVANVMPVLEKMAELGIPLCMHGEVTNPDVDIFDREAVFIETVLDPLRKHLPNLKIIMEHVTTKDGVDYVSSQESNLAATLTTHHLIINRNAILVGGIKPHYYCLPVAKRELHRVALVKAATSGDKRFFLGTDSAPHVDPLKECACGCAGIYSSINTMSCLAHVFEAEKALDRLEAFASLNGPAYYGLPKNSGTMTLVKRDIPLEFPKNFETGEGMVTVFDPMFPLYWEVT